MHLMLYVLLVLENITCYALNLINYTKRNKAYLKSKKGLAFENPYRL